jgi:hypothetical protein
MKSQLQALDRNQPGLPMKKGRAGTMTHDYKRHGTTTLFAALDVLQGKVIGQCMQRHRTPAPPGITIEWLHLKASSSATRLWTHHTAVADLNTERNRDLLENRECLLRIDSRRTGRLVETCD